MYLIVLWILFGIHHSFFASDWWKAKMRRILGNTFRFYRFFYSLFATFYLAYLLYYQWSIDSPRLWKQSFMPEYTGALTGLAGLGIMLVCVKKYFSDVMGVKAFGKHYHSHAMLQTGGLHSLVRHPLYLGTLLFIWSCFLIFPFGNNLIACILITVYTVVGTRIEERKLRVQFDEEYKRYAQEVPMLIPRIFERRTKMRHRLREQ